MYDVEIGRWHVVDKLAEAPSQIDKSPYTYTWNNPINLTDPDGNCPICPAIPWLIKGAEVVLGSAITYLTVRTLVEDQTEVETRTETRDRTEDRSSEKKLYRSMYRDADKSYLPAKGSSARTLGARPKPEGDTWIKNFDIQTDEKGNVKPGTGGMSVNIESTEGMAPHRKPPTHGGTGKDPMWSMEAEDVSENLIVVPDPSESNPNHAVVEPAYEMSFEEYQNALEELQWYWSEDNNTTQ